MAGRKATLLVLALLVMAGMSACGSQSRGNPVSSTYLENTARALIVALVEQRCADAEKLMAPTQKWAVQDVCGTSNASYLSARLQGADLRFTADDEAEVILSGTIRFQNGTVVQDRSTFSVQFRRQDGKWYVYSFE